MLHILVKFAALTGAVVFSVRRFVGVLSDVTVCDTGEGGHNTSPKCGVIFEWLQVGGKPVKEYPRDTHAQMDVQPVNIMSPQTTG